MRRSHGWTRTFTFCSSTRNFTASGVRGQRLSQTLRGSSRRIPIVRAGLCRPRERNDAIDRDLALAKAGKGIAGGMLEARQSCRRRRVSYYRRTWKIRPDQEEAPCATSARQGRSPERGSTGCTATNGHKRLLRLRTLPSVFKFPVFLRGSSPRSNAYARRRCDRLPASIELLSRISISLQDQKPRNELKVKVIQHVLRATAR